MWGLGFVGRLGIGVMIACAVMLALPGGETLASETDGYGTSYQQHDDYVLAWKGIAGFVAFLPAKREQETPARFALPIVGAGHAPEVKIGDTVIVNTTLAPKPESLVLIATPEGLRVVPACDCACGCVRGVVESIVRPIR